LNLPSGASQSVGHALAEMLSPSRSSIPADKRLLVGLGWGVFGAGYAVQVAGTAFVCNLDGIYRGGGDSTCGGTLGYAAIPLAGGLITMAVGQPSNVMTEGWIASAGASAFQVIGLATAIAGHARHGDKPTSFTLSTRPTPGGFGALVVGSF
jgi:hypothetical protein